MDFQSLFNLPTEFEFEGKKYPIKELTFEQQARYSKWLRERARAAATVNPDSGVPVEVQQALYSAFLTDAAGGVYDYGGPACIKSMSSQSGMAYALYLMISAEDPSFDEMEAAALVAKEFERLSAVIAEKLNDPKFMATMVNELNGPMPLPSSPLNTKSTRKNSRNSRRAK